MSITLRRTFVRSLTVLVVAAGTSAAAAFDESPPSPTVSDDPADFTPNVVDAPGGGNGTVLKYTQVGSTMYAVGRIGLVQNADRTVSYQRNNLLAFHAHTGEVLPWAPRIRGTASAMVASPNGRYLFVGGDFRVVNGRVTRGLVKFNLATGRLVRRFSFRLSGQVHDLAWVKGHLLVGGVFTRGLRSVNPTTGRVDRWLTVGLRGRTARQTSTKAYRFAVNPAKTRLVVLGNFTRVGPFPRRQAAMIRLNGRGGRVMNWHPRTFDRRCRVNRFWTRGVDFSPGGRFFVIVAAGGGTARTICDAASRWSTAGRGRARPTWVNYTGSDSIYSVEVTRHAVYVGGHFRWLDNRQRATQMAPGAVERAGIGAIHPATGKALPWNPGKTRGHGTEELFATSAGLWVGSDGRIVNGEEREGIALMPTL